MIEVNDWGDAMAVSAKVQTRIASQLKRYQPILEQAKQRDISESDTSLIICEMLCDVLGYKKFENITTEHNIRGTYVDLAVQIDGRVLFLIEVKAIGIDLKDNHVKQAVDYAANKGADWVILTNGAVWRVYKIQFVQPIDKSLVCEIDLLALGPKNPDVIECFGHLCREEFSKETMLDFLQRKEVTSKFAIASVLLTDSMLDQLRKEVRRLSGVRVDEDYLRDILSNEIIKRDLIDSEDGKAAQATIKRYVRAQAREKSREAADTEKPAAPGPLPTANISTAAKAPVEEGVPTVASN